MGFGLIGVLATFVAWAGSPELATIEAERLVLEGRLVRSEGPIVIREPGGAKLEGQSGEIDLDRRVATLLSGTWTDPMQGTVSFARAEVDLDDLTGFVESGHLTAEQGRLELRGRLLSFPGDGTVVGEGVVVSRCGCERPRPWQVATRHAVVEPGKSVRFGPGSVRLFEVPAVPLPGGNLPLSRRSGVLFPSFAHGDNGWQASLPLYLTAGRSADITLTPEVLTSRALRGVGEGRYALVDGGGEVHASGGWDLEQQAPRGAAAWSHSWAKRKWTTAIRAQWLSDEAYLRDYADTFVERSLPWSESRLLLGWGGVELTSDTFQNGGVVPHQVAAFQVAQPVSDLPLGFLGSVRGLAWWEAVGETAWNSDPGEAMALGDASLSRPVSIGPLVLTPRLDAHINRLHGVTTRRGVASTELRLPLWRSGKRFMRLEPELKASTLVEDREEGRWALSPGLLYRATADHWLLETRAALSGTSGGWRGNFDGRVQAGSWNGWAQLGSAPVGTDRDTPLGSALDIASTGLAFDLGWLRLEGGWLFASQDVQLNLEDVHQLRGAAAWTPPGPLSSLRLSGGLAADVEGWGWLSRTVGLGWTHPTGCVSVQTQAAFSLDRTLPDIGVRFRVNP